MEPLRGEDFEWKGQCHQNFCWIDFRTMKCRCRDIATAKINDMEKVDQAYNGHWGKLL